MKKLKSIESVARRGVGRDVVDHIAVGAKLLPPLIVRPSRAVEMTDGMRGDLVSGTVKHIDVFHPPGHVVGRSAEIDRRIAAPIPRALVEHAARIRDQIGATDKEREVEALAALVHVGDELGKIAPALELGAIIKRHQDELRRALDFRAGGICDEKRRNGEHDTR
jgi:hypothetical protein